MSYIPDCRSDEFYNYDKLNEKDKSEIDGYDYAVEEVIDCLFDNPEFFEDDVIERFFAQKWDFGIAYEMTSTFRKETENRKVETYGDYVRYKILEWAEMHRDEIITSFIDSYGQE